MRKYPNQTRHDMQSNPSSALTPVECVAADDPDLLTWEDVGRCYLEPTPTTLAPDTTV